MSYSIEHKVSGNIHPAIKYMMDSDCIVRSYRVINTIRAVYFNSYSLALPRFYIKQTATLRHVVKRKYGFFEFCNYFFSRLGKSSICNVVVNFLQFFLSFLRDNNLKVHLMSLCLMREKASSAEQKRPSSKSLKLASKAWSISCLLICEMSKCLGIFSSKGKAFSSTSRIRKMRIASDMVNPMESKTKVASFLSCSLMRTRMISFARACISVPHLRNVFTL